MKKFYYLIGLILLIALPYILWSAYLSNDNQISSNNLKIAELNHTKYPKLANLFYRWHIEDSEVELLAKYDILIIDMEVQNYSPDKLIKIKKLNPNIKLLAYLACEEVRADSNTLDGTLRKKLYKQINKNLWLKNDKQEILSWWSGNNMFNISPVAGSANSPKIYDVLPEFVQTEIIDSGLWDGVFYDNVWSDISFLSYLNIDLDQNGQKDSIDFLNSQWREGMNLILENTRKTLGSGYLVMGNGGEYYANNLNGALYENFPNQGWAETLKKYTYINENGVYPSAGIINSNVNNTGDKNDYQKMRFGLASVLLGDGYSSFDNGDASHNEVWWYDEYEIALGKPVGSAFNVLTNSQTFSEGLWRRDFNNGLVLVNSSNQTQSVNLGGEYEKIQGTQDVAVNDGSFVEEVVLKPKDGLILLRVLDRIFNAVYINGSFARVYNQYGNSVRSGFFAYDDKFRGSNQIIEQDINGDSKKEFVVADDTKVQIFASDGTLQKTFYPYTENYNKGINISVGDLDNNGTLEIITGTERGGGPQIRIFNNQGVLINPGFFAYAESFRGGVNVTVGDLDGDGYLEIIAGAGVGGGPHVRIFAADGRCINPGFFAFDPSFRGGVNVAAGDINNDGKDEIITGPGQGGAPHVIVYDKDGNNVGPDFYAFDKSSRQGVEVSATDLDEDGKAEIITTTSDVFTLF